MPSTRRYHRKTKTGCIPCKNRHSKCDEQKPQCSGCIRHQTSCVYPSSSEPKPRSRSVTKVIERDDLNPSQEALQEKNTSPYPNAPSFQLLNVTDLKNLQLLHQYTTATYATVSCNRGHDHLWQKTVPALAFDCPFLMHGILCVAAHHLASLKPDDSSIYQLAAARNQELALPLYRAAVSTISEENGQQIFAFSALLMICAIPYYSSTSSIRTVFSSTAQPEAKAATASDSAEWIFDWMRILRGMAPITHTLGKKIWDTPLGTIIQDYFRIATCKTFDGNPFDARLEALLELVQSPKVEAEDLEHYQAAIYELRRIFAVSLIPSEEKSINSLAFSWPVIVSLRFFTLLEARKPEAMIILAYYAVFLLKLDFLWWMRGVAARFVNECKRSLEEQEASWAISWIEWPIQCISTHDSRGILPLTPRD